MADVWVRWLGAAARVALGAVLLWSGWSKVVDPAASVRAVRAYRLLPETLAQLMGYGLPVLEIALGVLLVVGLGVRLAAAISAGLLVMFVVGIGSAAARGLSIDCGCFGGGGDLAADESTQYGREVARDLLLLGLAGFLVWRPVTALSVDRALHLSEPHVPDATDATDPLDALDPEVRP